MRGVISLIKPGFGKIIYNNKESDILSLPSSFADKDIVEFDLVNGKYLNLVAYSNRKYYGKVIKTFSPKKGIILTSYPEILGVVKYNNSNLTNNQYVEFTLKKSKFGIEAVDVAMTKDIYKANMPIFTRLKTMDLPLRESFVSEIKKEILFKGVIKGRIKRIFDRGYGFIESEIGDIFFFVSRYSYFYKKEPSVSDEVYFSYIQNRKGVQVDRFFTSDRKKLPKKEWTIVVDNMEIPYSEYINFYNKDPNVGDLVSYIVHNNKVFFAKKRLKRVYFENRKVIEGKIKTIIEDKGIGFIQTKRGDVFFSIKHYQNKYNRFPKLHEKVGFIYGSNEKGFFVKKFEDRRVYLQKENFVNFVKVEFDKLYLVYHDDNKQEVYKFDPENLNEAIAVYKSNAEDKFKIEAIETILKFNYQSKNIKREELLEEYKYLLKKNSHIKEYALKFQEIEFDLSIYNSDLKKIEIIEVADKNIERINSLVNKMDILSFSKDIKKVTHLEKIDIIENNEKVEKISNLNRIEVIVPEIEIKFN